MNTYLFLDMDGVMNSTQSTRRSWRLNDRKTVFLGFDHICPIAANNLDWLLESFPKLKIVISSTWRLHHDVHEWERMVDVCPSIVDRVIGATPHLRPEKLSAPRPPRGHEIHKWLESNDKLDARYVIFDDDKDMDKVEDKFIWVDSNLGLTYYHIEEAAKRLGGRLK